MNLTGDTQSKITMAATTHTDMPTFVMDIGGWNVKFDLCDNLINNYKQHNPTVRPNVAGRQKV